MKKNLGYLSFVTAVVLFSGCGGGSSGGKKDETAPVFSASATYNFTLNEGEKKTVTVDVTDDITSASNIQLTANDKAINNSFNFVAPANVDADTDFIVKVVATDEAGNSATKNFTFRVKNISNTTKYSYVAPVGDKSFIYPLGDSNKTRLKVVDSKLTWTDDMSGSDKNYTAAVAYCNSLGGKLPTRNELFNTLDYNHIKTDANDSIVDRDFTYSLDIHGVWAAEEDGKKYYINQANGVDVVETNSTAVHFTRCVIGRTESDFNLTQQGDGTVLDNNTGLIWSNIENNVTSADAIANCTNGFSLPNINQLRTIYDFSKNEFSSVITAEKNVSLWSSTGLSFEAGKHYYMLTKNLWTGESAAVQSDLNDEKHSYICVKPVQ